MVIPELRRPNKERGVHRALSRRPSLRVPDARIVEFVFVLTVFRPSAVHWTKPEEGPGTDHRGFFYNA